MMPHAIPVVVVTGTIGAGKTAVATAMSEALHERGIRHGLIEVDWLGEVYPAPYPDDPYSTRFAMKNLVAIWPNFVDVGITRAVVTMTLENEQELRALTTALQGADVTVVRLEASQETRVSRIQRRELGNLRALFVAKTEPLARQMRRLGIGDVVVENDERRLQEVAEEILGSLGW